MVEVEVVNPHELDKLAGVENLTSRAVRAAAKRAATHAKVTGSKLVRQMFTVKKLGAKVGSIHVSGLQADILFKGPRLLVKEKYKWRKTKKGIFITIKKGQGGIVARSFENNGNLMRREGKSRYPISAITSLSIPQLFGHESVLPHMQAAAADRFQSRLHHEIQRLLGG